MSKECGFPNKVYRVACSWADYVFAPSSEEAAEIGASIIEMWLRDMGDLGFQVEEVAFEQDDLTSIHQGETKLIEAESFICASDKSASGEDSREVLLGEILKAAARATDRDEGIDILEIALRTLRQSKRQWLRTQSREEEGAEKKP
jgi:hypothetical protein